MSEKTHKGLSQCCEADAYELKKIICVDCGDECEIIEPDPPEECPTCVGFGELGPFGWEYPTYQTCPDCRGTGRAEDWADPDDWHDGRVDR